LDIPSYASDIFVSLMYLIHFFTISCCNYVHLMEYLSQFPLTSKQVIRPTFLRWHLLVRSLTLIVVIIATTGSNTISVSLCRRQLNFMLRPF